MSISKQFFGEVSSQSLLEIIKFYLYNNFCGKIVIKSYQNIGYVWVKNKKVLDATTDINKGIDAFYEVIIWNEGFVSFEDMEEPDEYFINRSGDDLLNEASFLIEAKDEPITVKIKNPLLNLNSFDEILDRAKSFTGLVCCSILDIESGLCLNSIDSEILDIYTFSAELTPFIKLAKTIVNDNLSHNQLNKIYIELTDYIIACIVDNSRNISVICIFDNNKTNFGLIKVLMNKINL